MNGLSTIITIVYRDYFHFDSIEYVYLLVVAIMLSIWHYKSKYYSIVKMGMKVKSVRK
ncbi:hypothetical protein KHA80_01485 [Anaerobacillus sp. HL2]|nr:hypothetical protein KHA80_01485 [Anaerobacillus sp. HL2]